MKSDDSRTQCFFERIGFAFQVTYVKIIMNTYLKIGTAKK